MIGGLLPAGVARLSEQVDQPEQIGDGVDLRTNAENEGIRKLHRKNLGLDIMQDREQKLDENIGSAPSPDKAVKQSRDCSEKTVRLLDHGNLLDEFIQNEEHELDQKQSGKENARKGDHGRQNLGKTVIENRLRSIRVAVLDNVIRDKSKQGFELIEEGGIGSKLGSRGILRNHISQKRNLLNVRNNEFMDCVRNRKGNNVRKKSAQRFDQAVFPSKENAKSQNRQQNDINNQCHNNLRSAACGGTNKSQN